MSQRRERLTERLPFLDTALDVVESWYHVPLVLVLVVFMFWIRVRDWRNFLVDGQVFFSGNDAWYHLREVRYTVRHWPNTMGFDPWTGFPVGKAVGQFGTLYDQLVATAALVVGGGSPSAQTTALALLFAPAVLGALVAVPVYFLGKRFGGRLGGVVGVAVLAFSQGVFLRRTVVGFSDHQAAEAFFQVLAVATLVVALAVAEREKPIYEQFAGREFAALRRPVGWAALAGFAFALYVWVWPPGVLLIGIFGVFLLIALPVLYLRGESPEHLAVVGAVSLGVAGILMLATFKTTEISASSFSLLQPTLALVGAVGCVLLAWFARTVESRDFPTYAYPGTVLGLFVVGVAVMALFLPNLFDFFIDQLTRIVGFGSSATSLTVGEAQPPYSTQAGVTLGQAAKQAFSFLYASYGLALLTGAAGGILLALGYALGRLQNRNRTAAAFVLVWTVFMLAATLTQQRFDYYLVAPVATLNAFFVGVVFRYVSGADTANTLRNFDFYQVLTVAMVVLFITAPLAVAGSGAAATAAGRTAEASSNPGSGVLGWNGALTWLNNSTPAEGSSGTADDPMDYYGNYDRTDDFDYPKGSYGVMSWWDYGHWITTLGHRVPVANPFQQHASTAANYLLARNESVANRRLPNESAKSGSEGTRYVMVDWKMAAPGVPDRQTGSKFFAPVVWYNANNTSYQTSDFLAGIYSVQNGQATPAAYVPNQPYYDSMLSRLYNFHGSAAEVKPVVFDYENPQYNDNGSLALATLPTGNDSQPVRQFQNMSAARKFVQEDGSARIGGIGPYPEKRVPALEHYRLVHATERTVRQQIPGPTSSNWVKTFERVPGAQVTGTGPKNSTVTASVEMKMPGGSGGGASGLSVAGGDNNSTNTFEYHQRARTDSDGEFTMTLPYSTTGYAKWGPKQGATNVSVRATGPYTFRTSPAFENGNVTYANATADVPEGAVNGRANRSISVDLEEQSVSVSNSNETNATNGTNAPTPGNATNASSAANASTSANATNASAANASADRSALVAVSREVAPDRAPSARVAR